MGKWRTMSIKGWDDLIICLNCYEYWTTYRDLCRRMGIVEGLKGRTICPVCYTPIKSLPPRDRGAEVGRVAIKVEEGGQRFFKFGERREEE